MMGLWVGVKVGHPGSSWSGESDLLTTLENGTVCRCTEREEVDSRMITSRKRKRTKDLSKHKEGGTMFTIVV